MGVQRIQQGSIILKAQTHLQSYTVNKETMIQSDNDR